ncbi:MAG: cyclic nucleotide-binding domain-containing protein [Desulfobacterales bacterium]|nr:cyclic nucleotide-binding domain-containing protein [Desulfobacterales bacterium]
MTIAQVLKKTSLFKLLSDDQLKAAVQLGQAKSFEPDEEIFKHGQEAKTIYVLLDGSVCLRIDAPEELDPMAETLLEPGSVFGTEALAKANMYNVTAECVTRTKVLAMDSAGLQEIIRQEPLVGIEVMAELVQIYLNRLNYTRTAITNLFRIYKSQTDKSKVFDVYAELP